MKLRIVSVNDVYELENLPRLASLVRRCATSDPADALLVFVAGDFLSPSLLSSIDGGRGMVECLDAIGVTHVTFGNHEDDLATDDLRARTKEVRARWLATNVRGFEPTLPRSDVVDVAGARVGIVGVVMNDAAVYRRKPFGGATVTDPNASAVAEAERLVREEGCAFVVPLTHQFLRDDRALAISQAGRLFPVICGGHEHEAVIEQVQSTWIVKAGFDAKTAVVIDIEAAHGADGALGALRTEVHLVDVRGQPDEPEVRALVDRHLARVHALENATLLRLPEGEVLSSVGARRRQTSLGTMIASRLRDATGADGALVNGGAIRGAREYAGAFTYAALRTEVPFDNEIVVVDMPGSVVASAIAASRLHAPVEFGGFLQVDDRMGVASVGHVLETIAGAPLEPERHYRIATVRNFFFGLDEIRPLVAFAEAHPERIPLEDSGRGIRLLLIDSFSIALWKQLGGFDALDTDGDGSVTAGEVAAALARQAGQPEPGIVADLVVRALDTIEVDHKISREEADAVE